PNLASTTSTNCPNYRSSTPTCWLLGEGPAASLQPRLPPTTDWMSSWLNSLALVAVQPRVPAAGAGPQAHHWPKPKALMKTLKNFARTCAVGWAKCNPKSPQNRVRTY